MRRDDALGLVGDPGCCCPRWRETSLALMILALDFRAILCDSLMRRNSARRSRGAPTHPNEITTGSADRKAGHVLGFYEGSSRDPRWTIREGVTAGSISTLVVPTGGARNDKEVWARRRLSFESVQQSSVGGPSRWRVDLDRRGHPRRQGDAAPGRPRRQPD